MNIFRRGSYAPAFTVVLLFITIRTATVYYWLQAAPELPAGVAARCKSESKCEGVGLMGCMALKVLLYSGDAVSPEQRIRIALWGPYIPTTFEILYPLAQGVFPHQAKMMERGARPHMSRKGAILTGVGHGRLWMVDEIGHCWPLEAGDVILFFIPT